MKNRLKAALESIIPSISPIGEPLYKHKGACKKKNVDGTWCCADLAARDLCLVYKRDGWVYYGDNSKCADEEPEMDLCPFDPGTPIEKLNQVTSQQLPSCACALDPRGRKWLMKIQTRCTLAGGTLTGTQDTSECNHDCHGPQSGCQVIVSCSVPLPGLGSQTGGRHSGRCYPSVVHEEMKNE